MYNMPRKHRKPKPLNTTERSLTMYYFNNSMMSNEAMMPRILAEDTGVSELRDPGSGAKTSFSFRRPGWLQRKKASPTPCTCRRPCNASC